MRPASLFISTLPLAFAACMDVQSPTTPRSAAPNQPVISAAAVALGDQSKSIYSNFGPRLTFDAMPTHTWITEFPAPGGRVVSQQFTPTRDDVFSAARVALTNVSGPGLITVLLHVDDQGLPGAIIDQMWIEALNPDPAVYVAPSTRFPALEAGAHYWLTVLPADVGAQAGWNWNVIGDLSSTNFALFQGQGWSIVPDQTRGAFQIDGQQARAQGPVVHDVSGGGTMPFEWEEGVEKITYTVTAQQMADGSAKGEMLFRAHDLRIQLKGTVTCLAVVNNRAYLSGVLTQINLPYEASHFALALEDNGEGSGATAPDRVTIPLLYDYYERSIGAGNDVLAARRPCMGSSAPLLEWTNGNVQVR
ncbi:MAG TPA: hypothetical protein VL383_10340 [Gemmatimonadaceae bacterium]|nr:hypothetical protein [Gemmatimonadaceae bacterium]